MGSKLYPNAFLCIIFGLGRKAQRTLARVDEEDNRCANNVGDIRLACASFDRELQTIVKQKEKLVLAESLRKLEVIRFF